MDQNSLKHTDSGNQELLSIRWLREWLLKDGGINRSAQVLAELAEQTEKCLLRGEQPPFCEMVEMRDIIASQTGRKVADHQPIGKWLTLSQLGQWWDAREEARTDHLVANGLTRRPVLISQLGGGRSNPNRFCFGFAEISESSADSACDQPIDAVISSSLHYTEEHLRAIFFLRWLLPGKPVQLRSWRGWVFMAGVLTGLMVMVLSVIFTLREINHLGPVTGRDLFLILMSGLIVFGILWNLWPWLQLPERRITIASDNLLPADQLFGQLRLIRNKDKKVSGWLSLVRYSSICTTCAGTVELSNGQSDFPGRIIGRCRDSPMEHVFSFDPVSLSGRPLR